MSLGLLGIYFYPESSDNLSHCLALGGITLPASLDYFPHMIRELRVARSTGPMSLHH